MADDVTARLELVRAWAREMISGHLPPVEGARLIAEQASDGLEHLAVFGQLAKEWGADETEECERKILEQASLLLADTA